MSFVHYFVSLDTRIYEPNVMDLAGFACKGTTLFGVRRTLIKESYKKVRKPLHISS